MTVKKDFPCTIIFFSIFPIFLPFSSFSDQLRSTISDFSLIKPFFQLLKPDSPRDVKLLFMKSLKQFMMHIAQEKEPASISTILWTPLLNFMEDDDVIVRLAFRYALRIQGKGKVEILNIIDHSHNDIILCFVLQLPECIVYYLSKDAFKHMLCSQSTLQFSGLMIKFQSFLVNGALEVFWTRMFQTSFDR